MPQDDTGGPRRDKGRGEIKQAEGHFQEAVGARDSWGNETPERRLRGAAVWAGGEGGDDMHVCDAVDGEEGEKKKAEGRPKDGRPEGSRSEVRVRIRVRVKVTHSQTHPNRGEAFKKEGGSIGELRVGSRPFPNPSQRGGTVLYKWRAAAKAMGG